MALGIIERRLVWHFDLKNTPNKQKEEPLCWWCGLLSAGTRAGTGLMDRASDGQRAGCA